MNWVHRANALPPLCFHRTLAEVKAAVAADLGETSGEMGRNKNKTLVRRWNSEFQGSSRRAKLRPNSVDPSYFNPPPPGSLHRPVWIPIKERLWRKFNSCPLCVAGWGRPTGTVTLCDSSCTSPREPQEPGAVLEE